MRDLASLRSRLIKMEKKFGLERFCFGSREFRRKLFFFSVKNTNDRKPGNLSLSFSLSLSLSLILSFSFSLSPSLSFLLSLSFFPSLSLSFFPSLSLSLSLYFLLWHELVVRSTKLEPTTPGSFQQESDTGYGSTVSRRLQNSLNNVALKTG